MMRERVVLCCFVDVDSFFDNDDSQMNFDVKIGDYDDGGDWMSSVFLLCQELSCLKYSKLLGKLNLFRK
jgi:hypothetical protein